MNDIINWNYEAMRAWYLKHTKYVDETKNVPVYGFLYESKKPSRSNNAKVEPFVAHDMKWTGLSPVQNKELFPNNLYTLMDGEDSKKKWLFFVYPTVKQCTDTNEKELFAEHFSFCIDKSDKKKPCHFHSTAYSCIKIAGDIRYISTHNNDFMPDKLMFPLDDPNVFKKHVAAKDTLLNIIKYPWIYDKPQSGGAKGNTVPSRPITNEPFHREFCDKWTLWGIKRMYAIGVRKGNVIHWNVSIFKGRVKMGRAYQSLHYTTPVASSVAASLYEHELWRHIVQDFVPWW